MGHNLSGDILTSLNTRVPSPLAGKGQEERERRLEHDSTASQSEPIFIMAALMFPWSAFAVVFTD